MLARGLGPQIYGKTHLLQSHGTQHLHQVGHKTIRCPPTAFAQFTTGLAQLVVGSPFLLLDTLLPHVPIQLRGGCLKFIPAVDEFGQALAITTLQTLKLGNALLKIRQSLGMTVQFLAVVLQRYCHTFHLALSVLKALQKRLKGGINGHQRLQLPLRSTKQIQGCNLIRQRLLDRLHHKPTALLQT